MNDKHLNEAILGFMDNTHVALRGLVGHMERLEGRIRVIEAAIRSPKGTEGEDTGTRGNK